MLISKEREISQTTCTASLKNSHVFNNKYIDKEGFFHQKHVMGFSQCVEIPKSAIAMR
jgi:hypothetical protein